jgi:hypothetical protein
MPFGPGSMGLAQQRFALSQAVISARGWYTHSGGRSLMAMTRSLSSELMFRG